MRSSDHDCSVLCVWRSALERRDEALSVEPPQPPSRLSRLVWPTPPESPRGPGPFRASRAPRGSRPRGSAPGEPTGTSPENAGGGEALTEEEEEEWEEEREEEWGAKGCALSLRRRPEACDGTVRPL